VELNLRELIGKYSPSWESVKTFLLWFLSFNFVLLFLTFIAYHLIFAHKVIPHVFLGKARLSGLEVESARQIVTGTLGPKKPQLEFLYQDKIFDINANDIGFYFDATETLNKAFKVAREGTFGENLILKISAAKSPVTITPAYSMDQNKLIAKLEEIQAQIGNTPLDASFLINGNSLVVTDSQPGIGIDKNSFEESIVESFIDITETSPQLPLPIISKNAQINNQELIELKDTATNKVFNPPTLVYGSRVWKITPEQMLNFLSFKKNPRSGAIEMLINSENIQNYIYSIAAQIDTTASSEEFQIVNDRVLNFKPALSGKSLNQNILLSDLTDFILGNSQAKQITLAVSETQVPSGLNEYGISDLLGEGQSNFSGSIQGRIHNILLSSARISGVLVPPGEIFSFNDVVGEISGETGYHPSYIIKKGRTILDDGGGVCQTSTTLFRAALYAGLKIVKRFAHAYRVGYYEIGSPVGFDATIYRPSVDFQFENDTENYILVQAEWNEAIANLWIRIYGAKDGREIQINGPTITNESSPPEPLYIEEASLPTSTTKQIDWAAPGASVTITRKVIKNGEVLSDDIFESHYRPWQAVFLVGTG